VDDDEIAAARRLAAVDQVSASTTELSRIVSAFYRALVRSGVPRRLAADLTRDLLATLTSSPRDPLAGS
jgi:hypothetical protein